MLIRLISAFLMLALTAFGVAAESAAPEPPADGTSYLPTEPMAIRLDDPDYGRQLTLNLSIAVETDDLSNLHNRMPKLRSAILLGFQNEKPDDLLGPGDMERLRDRLKKIAAKAVAPVKVKDILFLKIVVY